MGRLKYAFFALSLMGAMVACQRDSSPSEGHGEELTETRMFIDVNGTLSSDLIKKIEADLLAVEGISWVRFDSENNYDLSLAMDESEIQSDEVQRLLLKGREMEIRIQEIRMDREPLVATDDSGSKKSSLSEKMISVEETEIRTPNLLELLASFFKR
ncbi:MAG: hypothetical protein EP338_02545 [Bacteroidetes bacterium]|nr:MAG: hypothetical protein EP338_02545 [Bacteroidota bacterium]